MLSIDFDKAALQADALEQATQGMYSQSEQLKVIADELFDVWHGGTADIYLKELKAFSAQLKDEAKRCGDAAEAFLIRISEIQAVEGEATQQCTQG